jgi:S1-C subfamily serine protease
VSSAETFDAVVKLLPPGFSPEVILALIATTPDVQHPSGSAVLISPHCALTAKHVIEDYVDLKASANGRLAITGRSGLVKDHENTDWRFDQVVLDPNPKSDLALLVLSAEEPPITGLRYPTIYIPPPETGDEIIAVGFPSSTIEPSVDKGGPVSRWNDLPTISYGRVFEVHHQKRDEVLANFPSFMADCKVDGGMSGGPVFDRHGFLRGIISRGFSINSNKSHTTTIQSIWTSLLLPTITSSLVTKGYGKSLYEAVQQGRIVAIGMERLDPEFREDGALKRLSLLAAPIPR